MEYFTKVKEWVMARATEFSTLDGSVIVGVSVAALLAAPAMEYIAALGIVYGIVAILRKDKNR